MQPSEAYLAKVIASQTQLFAYILALLADRSAADDVLQEVNLVLIRKAAEFDGGNFDAWAFRIARVQCQAYWTARSRDRLVFDVSLLDELAQHAEGQLSEVGKRVAALRDCLGRLTEHQHSMLDLRYGVGGSLKALASKLRRSEASVSQSLYRVRMSLLECIRSKLSLEGEC